MDGKQLFGLLISSSLVGITTLYIIYWYFTRNHAFWAKRGVPFVKPRLFLGSIWETISKPHHETEHARYKTHGAVFGYFEGNRAFLSVGDPELIRDILMKDFQFFTNRRTLEVEDDVFQKVLPIVRGDDWKRIRTIVNSTFTIRNIKKMINIFTDCSKNLVSNFRTAAEKEEPIDIKKLYLAFTLDIIASSAFATKTDSHNEPRNEFVQSARHMFNKSGNWRLLLFILCPAIVKLFGIKVFYPRGMKIFTDALNQTLEERKRTEQKRNDFLNMLIDASEEAIKDGKLDISEKEERDLAENYGKIDDDQMVKSTTSIKELSFVELLAQCITFFLAGYQTVATALSFATCCLALNPDIQEKLIEEVDETLDENKGELTYEAVQRMKYLDNIISEAFRMCPPVLRLVRMADHDYNLGKTGITIPKGTIVTIPHYAIHRDPKYFQSPDKFDPERFTPEERAKRDQYTYLPFGAGPRNCVGIRFALMEIKVCLANVVRNFRIKRSPEMKEPLEYYFGQSLSQPKPATVLLEIRKDVVKASN